MKKPESKASLKRKAETKELLTEFLTLLPLAKGELISQGAPTHGKGSVRVLPRLLNLSQMVNGRPTPNAELGPQTLRALAVRNTVFLKNQGLILKLAYHHRGSHLTKEESQSAASFGLLRAIEEFDPSRGTQLSTFASIWIRHYIQRATVRTGHSQGSAYLKHALVASKIFARTGETATAEQLGLTEAQFKTFSMRRREVPIDGGLNVKQRRMQALQTTAGFEKSMGCKNLFSAEDRREAPTLADVLASDQPSPEDELLAKERKKLLHAALKKLSAQEREFVKLLFLNGNTPTYVRRLMGLRLVDFNSLHDSALSSLKVFLTDAFATPEML